MRTKTPSTRRASKSKADAPAQTGPKPKLRIVLADDHLMIREGLKSLIHSQSDLQVVGEAANGREALRQVKELQPDLLILDISMPEINGIQAMEKLKQAGASTRVLVLTAFGELAYLRHLLAAGAAGYVLKQAAFEVLITAIRTVAAGDKYLDPTVTSSVVSGFVEQKALRGSREGSELSEREREVLRYIAQGHSHKEIGAKLGISVKTVETHKANFMEKLGLRSRVDIVRFALQKGWLEDSAT